MGQPIQAKQASTAAAVAVGSANAEGSAQSLARSDHTHEVSDLKVTSQAQGDILYFNGSNWVRLPPGTAGQRLKTNGAAANPAWVDDLVDLAFTVTGSGGVGTDLATGTNLSYEFPPSAALTIINVFIVVKTAPTGGPLTVDVNKNGTTIFTTQSGRPSIAASGTEDTSDTPDVTSLAVNDNITIDIDLVGVTTPGQDLTVIVRCKR